MWRGKKKLVGEDSTPASTFSSFSKVLGNLFHCSRDCLKHLAFTERVLAGAIQFSHCLKENLSLISFPSKTVCFCWKSLAIQHPVPVTVVPSCHWCCGLESPGGGGAGPPEERW